MRKSENHILFFEMENKFNLFDLRLNNKYPLWDVVRFYVWMRLNNTNYKVLSSSSKSRSSIKNLLKSFFSLRKIFFNNYDNFFYSCSRIPNNNNEYFDPYFEKIKNLVPGRWITYETMIGKAKYFNLNNVFDITTYIKIIFNFCFRFLCLVDNRHKNEINQINVSCKETFGVNLINTLEIKMIITHFLFELYWYKFLLKHLRIKKIFYHGFSKSLMQAAKELNIPFYEFQHGEITNATICYIYSQNVRNIITPDKLFTYSEVWTAKKNIPYNCVAIGSINDYTIKIKEPKIINSVVIISSPFQSNKLTELAFKLNKKDPNILIYYKLHPMEFYNYDYFNTLFNKHKMIKLVDLKYTIFDVLSLSNEFILSYSTTLYELLNFNKKIYLFRDTNYDQNTLLNDELDVPIFNSIETLIELRNNSIEPNLKQLVFFKPFNVDLFKSSISDVRS